MSSKVYCCGCSLKTKTLVIGFFSLFLPFIVLFIDGKKEWSLEVYELNFFSLWIEKMNFALMGLFISFCLIYGAIGEKKWFLMPYITISGSGILFFAVYGVPQILYASLSSSVELYSHAIFAALFILLILIIMVYSWMTVSMFFVELVKMELLRDGVNYYPG